MKLLLLGLNYAPEPVGIAVYTAGMAEKLAARGHAVRVIAGRPYYPAWRIMAGHNGWMPMRRVENGVDVIRLPHYIPARPSGLQRLLHHASFALSSLVPTLFHAVSFRPDVVMTVAPSLIAAPVARLAAAITGARSWLHVQDFEMEAAFATGLLARTAWRARAAAAIEQIALQGFDRVTSISTQMCARLIAKGVLPERVGKLRNWADIANIRPLDAPSPYRARWNIATPYVALYSGNIGNKQGIEIVVEAARRLACRQDLTFVICGEGPNRNSLQAGAAGLGNIQFHDLQPSACLSDLLGLATVHLLPQRGAAADLVLPSKMANMLASGRPVVATAGSGAGIAAELDGCGLVTPPGDAKAFADGIARLLDDPALARSLGAAGRKRAESHWLETAILDGLEADLLELAAKGQRALAVSGP